jgi:hypothetical protein
MKYLLQIFLVGLIIIKVIDCKGQNNDNLKLINDFETATQNHLSFQNGLSSSIVNPTSDEDALRKGFQKMQTDSEDQGGWVILESSKITVDDQEYTAILYEYKQSKFIALHYKMKGGDYYFRIYNPSNFIGNKN